jgi:hypothetical protein
MSRKHDFEGDFDLNEVARSFGFDLNDLGRPDFDLGPFFDRVPAFDFGHFDRPFFELPNLSLEGLPGAAEATHVSYLQ